MNFDFDVAIIGAGPIGSSLAYELSKEDINVCLIDKKRVIGLPLQCAGIINKRVLDLIQIPDEIILNKARGAFIHSKNHSLKVFKDEDQALIIDRVGLDQYLYKKALDCGVKTYLSSKVLSIDDEFGKIEFQKGFEVKTIKSKVIVGADGPSSLVSSTIGNDFNYYCASQYLVKANNELFEEYDVFENHENGVMSFVNLYAYEDLFPGFLWQIPIKKNVFRVGLFSNHDYKKQSEILDYFLKNDFKYDDYEVIEKHKGKIPIYNQDNRLYKNRALIIGDAASQVKPTTGGGLFLGFKSVKIAKDAIVNALNSDEFNSLNDKFNDLNSDEFNSLNDKFNDLNSKEINHFAEGIDGNDQKILQNVFRDYQKNFEKRFLKEMSYQFKVQKTLSTLSDEDLDYLFVRLKEKGADKLISEYGDMDNQSLLVKEFLKRGLIFSLLPKIHKKELVKIWF